MTRVETYPTLLEASRAMGRDAVFMGGGTVVMREVNAGRMPARLLRTTDPDYAAIRASGDAVSLGAGVTMAAILASRELDFLHPVARLIGGPQVRNMGTIGGNLFAPHPYGDFAAALIALGARVSMADGGAARPVEDLLRDRAHGTGLAARIDLSRPRPGSFAFRKVSRVKPKGVSILSVAVLAPREGGRIRGARVGWGAMGEGPRRGEAVERALEGQALDAATIARAAEAAVQGLSPPTDAIASGWYRGEVAGVHLRRLLEDMERA